jgi:hypothetical protein
MGSKAHRKSNEDGRVCEDGRLVHRVEPRMHPLRHVLVCLASAAPSGGLVACGGDEGGVTSELAPLTPREPAIGGRAAGRRRAGGEASTEPLPDLVLDAAYLIDTVEEDRVTIENRCLIVAGCVSGLGQRRVVRFGSRTGNVGNADLRLGTPSPANPYYTFDACQEEFSLMGFARYELLAASSGEVVATGIKNGFCIRDSEPYELEGGPRCATYDCNRQGIGRGCSDNYGSSLECQWLDITDVSSGAYTLRVMLNASFALAELDYSNNVVEVPLRIGESRVSVEP